MRKNPNKREYYYQLARARTLLEEIRRTEDQRSALEGNGRSPYDQVQAKKTYVNGEKMLTNEVFISVDTRDPYKTIVITTPPDQYGKRGEILYSPNMDRVLRYNARGGVNAMLDRQIYIEKDKNYDGSVRGIKIKFGKEGTYNVDGRQVVVGKNPNTENNPENEKPILRTLDINAGFDVKRLYVIKAGKPNIPVDVSRLGNGKMIYWQDGISIERTNEGKLKVHFHEQGTFDVLADNGREGQLKLGRYEVGGGIPKPEPQPKLKIKQDPKEIMKNERDTSIKAMEPLRHFMIEQRKIDDIVTQLNDSESFCGKKIEIHNDNYFDNNQCILILQYKVNGVPVPWQFEISEKNKMYTIRFRHSDSTKGQSFSPTIQTPESVLQKIADLSEQYLQKPELLLDSTRLAKKESLEDWETNYILTRDLELRKKVCQAFGMPSILAESDHLKLCKNEETNDFGIYYQGPTELSAEAGNDFAWFGYFTLNIDNNNQICIHCEEQTEAFKQDCLRIQKNIDVKQREYASELESVTLSFIERINRNRPLNKKIEMNHGAIGLLAKFPSSGDYPWYKVIKNQTGEYVLEKNEPFSDKKTITPLKHTSAERKLQFEELLLNDLRDAKDQS